MLIQKEVLINLLLGRLALSHLRLNRFPFRPLLRLAMITVEVFLPASTRGFFQLKKKLSNLRKRKKHVQLNTSLAAT
jgi:hypothetical protein